MSTEALSDRVRNMDVLLSADEIRILRDQVADEIAALEAKLEAMEQSTVCAYCGRRFGTDVRNAEVEEHIWKCDDHPLANLVFEIEEKCKDLDYEAQELLRASGEERDDPSLNHASGIHSSIDAIRKVVRYAEPSLDAVQEEQK